MEKTTNKKIELVDDSDLVARIVTDALEAAGFTVVRGANGAEGVELAYREIPDAIIMDAEMPVMQGYLASRLLKNQRGVRDIPIIMHTSLSEDHDKYWALASGADRFAAKDFDNIDGLVKLAADMAASAKVDAGAIRADAETMSRERVFEMMGAVLDEHLFQSCLTNSLGQIGRNMTSLPETARGILRLLDCLCESHIAVLMTQYGKTARAFVCPAPGMMGKPVDEFISVCLGDFYRHFPSLDLSAVQTEVSPPGNGEDPPEGTPPPGEMCSYASFVLRGRGDLVIGTLHVGNSTNNYFSQRITRNVELFARDAGIVLENSIMFNQACEMQLRIRSAFSKYVPQEIIDDLIERPQGGGAAVGEKRVVTVLFSDMRNFTTISENNSAEAVVAFLNRFFNVMVSIIKKHGGTIDKFIGDAILAFFGAPTSYADNTPRAVRAAVEMIEALPSVEPESLALPETGFNIGIGIHEGEAIIGNIGSQEKSEYTAIGDTVNLASRLEGLTKHYQVPILISDAVATHLDASFRTRELDSVRVKGKETVTRIFSVLSSEEANRSAFLDLYDKGLKMYRIGNWATATEYLSKALACQGDDKSAAILLERCRLYQSAPPEDWDGSQAMDFK